MTFSQDPIHTLENLPAKTKPRVFLFTWLWKTKKIEKIGGSYFRAMKVHGSLIHLSYTNEVLEKPILF